MGLPVDEIDDPDVRETKPRSLQERRSQFPEIRRLQGKERIKNQTDAVY